MKPQSDANSLHPLIADESITKATSEITTLLGVSKSMTLGFESALDEYKHLEKECCPGPIDTTNAKEVARYARMQELWPLVQDEIAAGKLRRAKAASKPDDEQQALELLTKLADGLRKFGYQKKSRDALDELLSVEHGPSLLERLVTLRSGYWHEVHNLVLEILSSGFTEGLMDRVAYSRGEQLEHSQRLGEYTKEIRGQQSSSAKVPLFDDDVHVGIVDLSELTKLCTSLLRQDKRQGTLYRDEAGRFIHLEWDYDEKISRTCRLMRPADAYEVALKADQFFVSSDELIAELAESKPRDKRPTETDAILIEKTIEIPSAQTQGEAETATKTREQRIAALDVRHKHAIWAFDLAEVAVRSPGERFTLEKAWGWVEENYEDYRFPSKQAFKDYVSQARGKLGENVNQPRRGRPGRSIVHQSEI